MRRTYPGVAGATPRLFATFFSAICLAALLTTLSASAADIATS